MKAIKIDAKRNMAIIDFPAPLYNGLEKLLNGTPEHVRPKRLKAPYCMMVDDCGLMKNLPDNPTGCYLYQTDKHGSPIAGDIYIMKEVPSGGSYDVAGLDDGDISALLKHLSAIPEPWTPTEAIV